IPQPDLHISSRLIGISYLFENLGWEKMLNIAARQARGLKTVGYQHTVIPLQLLNYFNHKPELENRGFVQSLPAPDYVGCVGNIPAKSLLECGWKQDKIFTWGTIRHNYLKDVIKSAVTWQKRENSILVALSMEEKEAKEVLLCVYQAFNQAKGLKVFIKGHYASLSVKKLCKKLSLKLSSDVFEVTNKPIGALLKQVRAVVVGGSTVALEAIANGCPVIIPRLANIVDINPLTGFSSLGMYASSPSDLSSKVKQIINMQGEPIEYEKCKDFITGYFSFLGKGESFLSRLEKVIADGVSYPVNT
ncbi:MAG: hypothetical protein PHE97_01645, partial [Candidatus Omnitrophica bacterium]|nr:hypothetical protein [Candidatus Omnitrophota bacterium]